MSESSVNYHAKQFFLTYPRCPAEKEALRDLLVGELGGEDYVIAREAHEDGAYHLHAYIRWGRPKRVRDPHYFDLRVGEHTYHPNIQTVRTPAACQKYIAKDGDYISNMEVGTVRLSYGEIVRAATGPEDFLARLEENYPRDVVLNLQRIDAYTKWKWPKVQVEEPVEFTRFVIPDELEAWYEDNVVNRENGMLYPLMPILASQDRSGGAPAPSLAKFD